MSLYELIAFGSLLGCVGGLWIQNRGLKSENTVLNQKVVDNAIVKKVESMAPSDVVRALEQRIGPIATDASVSIHADPNKPT